jgi:hypothetical protein
MALLFGYLVALAVFLSGGYLGLEWLASPDAGPHAPAITKSASHRPAGTPKAPPSVTAAADPAAGISHQATRRETADANDATGSSNLDRKAGEMGCQPIGLTSDGQMVFPLRCRELIESRHVQTPVPAASAPEAGTMAHKSSEAVGPSKPQGGQRAPEHVAAAASNEQRPTNAEVPTSPKPSRSASVKPQGSEREAPGQARPRGPAADSRRSHGHLANRLAPPTARMAMQDNWYNPLGLH